MTYDEALAFWYGRINYEVKSAHAQDLKLERMRALLSLLGNPDQFYRVIHIAGTKGKGSTAAMVESILRAAGYRTGLFTSPHLTDVRERIQVNRQWISPAELVQLMEQIAPHVEKVEADAQTRLTFFEISTALGFLHFFHRRVEVAVVEVGLGGKFDSTNVCQPDVSVITTIGYDHMAQLGNTLELIAEQKAGIIKPGVPCVSGVQEPGPAAVIAQIARRNDAPLACLGVDLHFEPTATGLEYSSRVRSEPLNIPRLALRGRHQVHNAACALAAVEHLVPPRCRARRSLTVPDRARVLGLAKLDWPARIEVLAEQPVIILDSAHNVPSVVALAETLARDWPKLRPRTLVFAVSADKQYEEMLGVLANNFDRILLTRFSNNPRSVEPSILAACLSRVGFSGTTETIPEAPEALEQALALTPQTGLVSICGSVFLAGELRMLLTQRTKNLSRAVGSFTD